jgi:aspartyl-tRNA(Asn)/glutamyl-tRNA(Gln) amidotransferase subunit A
MNTTSAHAVVAAVRGRRTAAEAVARAAAERIAASTLGAVVDFDPDEGVAAARAVDRRLAGGEDLPLAGLPVLIKDTIWVAGRRVTNGSALYRDFRPPCDAIVVERLKRAGAVIMGMANTSEFACKGVTKIGRAHV